MRTVNRLVLACVLTIGLLLALAQPALAASRVHVVQPGETLYRIALKYGVTVQAIQAANGLTGARIYAGQSLVIPDGSYTAAPTGSSTAGGIHIVQPGENLYRIGLKYGVPWPTLQAVNGLASSAIYAGQRLTIPGSGSRAAPAASSASASPPAGTGKRFVVDLSEQRLYAYEGDTLVRTTLVSTGLSQYPTVTGTYRIYVRYVAANMSGPGYFLPNVPYVMYFYRGYGLHGTYWHNNFGTPMSHGCVNLPTAEAEWAFNWSTIGTPVIIQW